MKIFFISMWRGSSFLKVVIKNVRTFLSSSSVSEVICKTWGCVITARVRVMNNHPAAEIFILTQWSCF